MPPILVVMSNLALLLMMKLEIFGSSFCPLDMYFHLVVKYAFIQFFFFPLKFHAACHPITLGDICIVIIRITMSAFSYKEKCIVNIRKNYF